MSVTSAPSVTNALEEPSKTGWRRRLVSILMSTVERCRQLPAVLSRPVMPIVSALAEGLALGVLRRTDVDDLVTATYESHRRYYDPRRYQQPHEAGMLSTLQELAPGPRLLDAFCGQGREAEVFAGGGFDVTGVDRLGWMISAAQEYAAERGFTANFVAADFDALNVNPGFDVVYTSNWMYSTQQGHDRKARFLARCRSLCADGGLIVFSIVQRSRLSSVASCFRFLLARLTAYLTFGNRQTEFGERLYSGLFWHHLSRKQVSRQLQSAGLRLRHVHSGIGVEPAFYFVDVAPLCEDSERDETN